MDTTQTPQEKKGLGRLWKKFRAAFKDKEIPSASTTTKPTSSKPEETAKKTEEPVTS